MFTLKRVIGPSLILLVLCGTALAQEQAAPSDSSSTPTTVVSGPLVTATVSPDRVRFVSPGTVVQLRLEVYSEAGQKLFDTELRGGNVLDWYMQDGAGQPLTAGSYACVLTVKSLSGRLSQRVAVVTINGKSVVAAAGTKQLSMAQQQTIGPMEGNAALAIQEREAITAVTHNGSEGQLTSTTGALTFRTGDLFFGQDKERMRITPDGNVGIGTDKPQSALDVVGTIRTTNGVEFADGSRLNVTDGKLVRTSAAGTLIANATGTGTTGRLTKWTDGPAGTLGDSLLGESGGGVEIRSAAAGAGINPMFINPNNAPDFSALQAYPATGTNTNLSMAIVPKGTGSPNNRAQLTVFNTDYIADATNYEFVALRARGSDFIFGTGKAGAGLNRPLVFAAGFLSDNITNNNQLYMSTNGNVGIGTNNPTTKLDVSGSIKLTGLGNGINFPDGTTQTTAPTGGVTGTGTTTTVPLWTSATALGNSVITQSSGSIGIGTTTPAAKLDVAGNVRVSGSVSAASANIVGSLTVADNLLFVWPDENQVIVEGVLTVDDFINAPQYKIGFERVLGVTGTDNVFVGIGAGEDNSTGASNSFFGKNAGASNSTASFNSFFGSNAGAANTASNNSFFGKDAGLANTSGDSNSFFGKGAGAANTTAEQNSFFGKDAGLANTTGENNSFFGTNAGDSNTDGDSNSFFGKLAGGSNTSGNSNTFVGHNAGASNTSENSNTFLGASSNGAAAITNATAIGANAVVTQSDSLVLGNGVKVGAGISAPREKLHVLNGNIFIEFNVDMPNPGLILKSPNGMTCAKLTIDNAGALVTTVITCP